MKKQIVFSARKTSSNYCVNPNFYEQMTETAYQSTVIYVGLLVTAL